MMGLWYNLIKLVRRLANNNVGGSVKMAESNDVLYYYCSLKVFKSIIENKSIWLSNIRKSNDSLELEWLLKQYINFLNAKYSSDAEQIEFYKIINDCISADEKIKNILLSAVPIYVVCLSEKGDDLSQWRGYGDDGYGIAIGFNNSYFTSLNVGDVPEDFPYLTQITYASEEFLYSFFEKLTSEINSNLSQKEIEQRFIVVRKEIINKAPHFKNPAFVDEAEWRICLWSPKGNGIDFKDGGFSYGKRKFFNRRDNLVSYFDMVFSDIQKAIRHIYIGPKSKVEPSDIKQFLAASGISINDPNHKIIVERSKLSYR